MKSTLTTIIITGAGSGIGRELAFQLAEKGLTVLACGRRYEELEKTAERNSDKIIPLQADVTTPEMQDNIIRTAETLPGKKAIFHGAGYYHVGELARIDSRAWKQSFEINVTSRLSLTQKLIPQLKEGRVMFIGSDAGINIRLGAGAYSIAQSASQTLCEVLKQELKAHQIDVGTFKPGLVDTDMVRTFMKSDISEFPALTDYQKIIESGQIATPEHIARFACWLLLETTSQEYTENAWDIREKWHQKKWMN